MDRLSRLPFHPIIFTTYPILALLATNIVEVEIKIVMRPLLISLAGTVIVLLIVRLVLKDWRKAALVTTLLLMLFFSYGHLYQLLRTIPSLGMNIGRHRYLMVAYGAVFVIGLWLILKKMGDISKVTQALNLMGIVLLTYPLFRIINYSLNVSAGRRISDEFTTTSTQLDIPDSGFLPDIYYIILDTYTRADALQDDFGFDNSPFLDELRSFGFYIADCSRSNYSFTEASVTTTLNMEYLPELYNILTEFGLDASDIWLLLKNNRVRNQLEAIGYSTVAFATGYEWSCIDDADVYLSLASDPYSIQLLDPFEAMLIKSTAVLIFTDLQFKSFAAQTSIVTEQINEINFPYSAFAQQQLFILDQLPRIASFPGPKFVFVHILKPHAPLIFGPDGEILTDTGYYGGKGGAAINREYYRKGYVNEVQFINSRMLDIVRTIIAQSTTPPIIIIQGDTGSRGNPFQILNAYYLTGKDNPILYSSITPVNSFRVVFDTYFGTEYGLLPDESFPADDMGNSVPETSPACITR